MILLTVLTPVTCLTGTRRILYLGKVEVKARMRFRISWVFICTSFFFWMIIHVLLTMCHICLVASSNLIIHENNCPAFVVLKILFFSNHSFHQLDSKWDEYSLAFRCQGGKRTPNVLKVILKGINSRAQDLTLHLNFSHACTKWAFDWFGSLTFNFSFCQLAVEKKKLPAPVKVPMSWS